MYELFPFQHSWLQGNGAGWCNGDCVWTNGQCESGTGFHFLPFLVVTKTQISGVSAPPPPPPPPPPTCSTISGPDPECSFPFIFYGITWTGCTTVDEPADNPQPWCLTQTDADGNPIADENGQVSTWGYCHSSCPIDQGLALFVFFLQCLTIFS